MKNKNIHVNQIKEGYVFSDGQVVKRVYGYSVSDNLIIFLNTKNQVKWRAGVKAPKELLVRIIESGIEEQIETIPFAKDDLNYALANIYALAFLYNEKELITKIEELKANIKKRKISINHFNGIICFGVLSIIFLFIYILLDIGNVKVFIFANIGIFLGTLGNPTREMLGYDDSIFGCLSLLTNQYICSLVLTNILYNILFMSLGLDLALMLFTGFVANTIITKIFLKKLKTL